MNGICFIVGAGGFGGRLPERLPGDFLIAADGGQHHLNAMGVEPDLLLGDFDSIGEVPDAPFVLRFPAEKDDTDMMLAIREGLARGFARFALYGGLGGERLDHTVANMQALCFLAGRGARGFLVGGGQLITAVCDGALSIPAGRQGYVSVFCMGSEARGVALEGLKYPLRDAVLSNEVPLGVSNEFTGAAARVRVERGTLLVMWRENGFDPRCAEYWG